MKTNKVSFAVEHVKTAAFAMALLCWLVSTVGDASAQIGYAVGNEGTILRTGDGSNWVAQTENVPNVRFNAVDALPSVSGAVAWVVGNASTVGGPGTILYNQGSENNWVSQTNSVPGNLNGVSFVDRNSGWAVGNGGLILFSKGEAGERGWKREAEGMTSQNLYAVAFITKRNGKFNGWAVGANGTILFYDGENREANKWSRVAGPPTGKGSFRSVSARYDPGNPDRPQVFAVGDDELGIWQWHPELNKKPWKRFNAPSKKPDLRAVLVIGPGNVWLGQASTEGAADDVFNWVGGSKWLPKNVTGLPPFGNVYALSSPRDGGNRRNRNMIWAVGPGGHIGLSDKDGNWKRQDNASQQLNGIAVVQPSNNDIKLEGSTSPSGGVAQASYLSVTGHSFPPGDIIPTNVLVDLATQCRGPVSATISAVSVVNGAGANKFVSFLLPDGLVPGQYFVSISDYADSDAQFESSNCSVVNVVQ